jgi:uncharacterized protein
VEVRIGALTVIAIVSRAGEVVEAHVPQQGLEVRPEGVAPAKVAKRAPPAGVVEEPLEVASGGAKLSGALWLPSLRAEREASRRSSRLPKGAKGKLPLVIVIAGSGPTDRDGNSAYGLKSDCYRLLAEGLAKRGVATLRYDKRGVGASPITFDVSKVVLDDFVADAAALLAHARKDQRFSTVTLAGHSEGALIATQVARRWKVDALALLAGAGRPLPLLLREQLATKVDAKALADLDRILASLRAGQPLDPVPAALMPLFSPPVRAFLKSEIDLDPAALLAEVKAKTAIVQGDTDAQVTVADARALAAARPDAKLVILPGANHLFKAEPSRALPQASYTDPGRPLVPGVVEAIASLAGR